MTALERQISAESNRRYVRKLVARRGWTEELTAQAMALVEMAGHRLDPWDRRYFDAYENGHNIHHLSGVRLDHYAHCYADICEETGLTLSFASFWTSWEAGDAFEGTPGGNWHCVW